MSKLSGFLSLACDELHGSRADLLRCYSDSADSSGGAMSGMMQDLAFAIPGVDEAMGFAEIMKYTSMNSNNIGKHPS